MVHILPALLVLGPLPAALLVTLLGRRWGWAGNVLGPVTAGLTLLGIGALVPLVAEGGHLYYSLPGFIQRLEFAVDPFSLLLALAAGLVWFCATLYAVDYLRSDAARSRYHAVSLVLLAAMLGVLFAGNLLTMYLFFESLGLVAFLVVIHHGTHEARRAALKYLWFTLLGGVALLAGIFLVYALGAGWPVGGIEDAQAGPAVAPWAAALLVLGFGVKAGMVPVHSWLPDAHSAAPAPASALLSGVMIKAGAYGIFRTVTTLFGGPAGPGGAVEFGQLTVILGSTVLALGLLGMLLGAGLALFQTHIKRLLAWSSISQMGLILTGFGAAGVLAGEGGMAVAGSILHMVNHSLFKAVLFLGIGVVAWRTGESEMNRLGGLWRRMPLTFGLVLAAGAGLAGLPLFNGYVSKSLIQQAVGQLTTLPGAVTPELAVMAISLASVVTVAYCFKLIFLVFLGSSATDYGRGSLEAGWGMLLAMGVPVAAIITLGLKPQWLVEGLLTRGLADLALPAQGLAAFFDDYFLAPASLQTAFVTFMAGGLLFVFGRRLRPFGLVPPAPLPGGVLARRGWLRLGRWWSGRAERSVSSRLVAAARRLAGSLRLWLPPVLPASWWRETRAASVLARIGNGRAGIWDAARDLPEKLRRFGGRFVDRLKPADPPWQPLAQLVPVSGMRRQILRYSRDLGLNIVVIMALFLLLLIVLRYD